METAISGAAGDDDTAGANSLLAGESEQEAPLVRNSLALQAFNFIRDRRVDAELMRLVIGSCHQGQAADAGRKAQIVFDARRGTGLTAKGAAIEREHREPLGSCIDCGGKTCGTS